MSDTKTLEWFPTITLDDLWEGEMTDLEVEGETVLLIHLEGGEIVAYQGVCPHQEILLADGDFEKGILTCTAHKWQFEVNTGKGVNPKNCSLYRYEVRVEEEQIYIGFPKGETKRYNRCSASKS
ncbi:Rieske 2Fe-2S domain-containing protein [Bacillus sp. PK3_68]|uniref:Rieske 2Fe-2S domain-containing protein n=1 Tax=Bacillus sp. PK3_68 TaxID=2027408 RepID=UPI00217E7450|nr:Rieske 2Fe-2S domain-containing protein [Bacillus sp. PK3_68]